MALRSETDKVHIFETKLKKVDIRVNPINPIEATNPMNHIIPIKLINPMNPMNSINPINPIMVFGVRVRTPSSVTP